MDYLLSRMEYHELANIFPLLEGPEFDDLVAGIRATGMRDHTPIIVFEGKILDGRNRYRACQLAGALPLVDEFEGTYEEARALVFDLNLRRRHLDASQRAIAAAKLATIGHGGDRRSDQAANWPLVTQAAAAEFLSVRERSVRRAREVLDHGSPELVSAVERGTVSISAAAKVASLPRDEQAARLAEPKALTAEATTPAPSARPLRDLVGLSGGELARWVKITTPNDRPHVIRVLRMAADILEDELIKRE
jgi:hypothetical protein